MSEPPDLRASDAERERTVEQLFIGLLALTIKEHDRVVVDFDDAPGGGTRMVVHGRAPRRVRRAFAELSP